MRIAPWKIQMIAAMMIVSVPAFAKLSQNPMPGQSAIGNGNGSCGPDANKVSFNVDGQKDYYLGRDIEDDGDGWYFSAQGGEIVRPNKDGVMCMQTGMRIKSGTKADAGNQMGTQKCGSALNQTRSVEGLDGSKKEYLWKWNPGPNGDDKKGYLTITPLDANGNFGHPILRVSGWHNDAQGKQKANTDMTVSVDDTGNTGTGRQQGKGFTINVNGDTAGSQPTSEKNCLLGKLQSNGQDQVTIDWDKDKGVQKTIGDKPQQQATQDTSSASS